MARGLSLTEIPESLNGLESILAAAKAQGKGLLISIDDVRHHSLDDFSHIVKFVRRAQDVGERISLVYTGPPSLVEDPAFTTRLGIINDSWWIFLEAVETFEAKRALRNPFEKAEICIEDEVLAYAARASAGHPFLVQLIGYYLWRGIEQSMKCAETTAIDVAAVDEAFAHSMKAFNFSVLESSLVRLHPAPRTYLAMMARGDNPVQLSTVNEQLGYDGDQLPWECIELAHRDLIHSNGAGKSVFGIPYMREYLRSAKFLDKFDYPDPDSPIVDPE